MSQSTVPPDVADLAFVDELVSISMLDTTIVVRPTRRPDALGTQVFADVVNAATAAGATVVLVRDESLLDPTDVGGVPAANDRCWDDPVMTQPGGLGLLIVRSESAVWTIDFAANRLVRSDRPVDRVLLTSSAWTAFEAMWIAPGFVRAVTENGSFLTGRRARHHLQSEDLRDGRQVIGRQVNGRQVAAAVSHVA